MDRKTLTGLGLCALIFVAGFASSGNVSRYFNVAGLLIVVGGSVGAAIASFRMERLGYVLQVLRTSFRARLKEPAEIVEFLVDLSVKSKIRGVQSLIEDESETSIMFLRRALGFVVDSYSREQTADILNTEMYFFKLRVGMSRNGCCGSWPIFVRPLVWPGASLA